jgi:hypothetical protein
VSYFKALVRAKTDLVGVLKARKIQPRYLGFGGAGKAPARSPTVPTDARSEFLANRAMGDWAERLLADSIRSSEPDWQLSHYGSTERMAAGEAGFKEKFLAALEEARLYGKRPDLLIFPRNLDIPDDISMLPFEAANPLAKRAQAAIEVRSSKFEALKYIAVRAQDKEAGKKPGRETPSFTVKVEDLIIVYRWIERYQKPQAYAQVFFDSVFAINVLTIFQTIASGSGFSIESPAKSQQKATIFIPITSGTEIGRLVSLPKFDVAERVTRLGRHDAYVVPVGGVLDLWVAPLRKLLEI